MGDGSRRIEHRRRAGRAAGGLLVGLLLAVTLLVGPARAQVTTVVRVPRTVDTAGRTAGDRVDQIVLILRVVAGVVVVSTVGFWWHTRPERRLRAAIDRGEIDGPVGVVEERTVEASAARPALRGRPVVESLPPRSSVDLLNEFMARGAPGEADAGERVG